MTGSPEMFIKKSISCLCFLLILNKMFLKPSFKGPFGQSNILHSSASFAASKKEIQNSIIYCSNKDMVFTSKEHISSFYWVFLRNFTYSSVYLVFFWRNVYGFLQLRSRVLARDEL